MSYVIISASVAFSPNLSSQFPVNRSLELASISTQRRQLGCPQKTETLRILRPAPPPYMSKTGTIWQFFRALFPSTRFVDQVLGHTQTPRIFQIFVLSLLVSRSTLPRNAYFSWQTLNCQIVPVLPSHSPPPPPKQGRLWGNGRQSYKEKQGQNNVRGVAFFWPEFPP